MPAQHAITRKRLLRLTGTPNRPAFYHICTPADFDADPHPVHGVRPARFDDLPALVAAMQGRAANLICQKGRKLRQGAVSWPQAAGLVALWVGLARHYRDDQAQTSARLPIYGAFYGWAPGSVDETNER